MPNSKNIGNQGKAPAFNLWKSKNDPGSEINGFNRIKNHDILEGSLDDLDIAADGGEFIASLTTSPTARSNAHESGHLRGQKNTNNSVIEWLFPNGSNNDDLQDDSDMDEDDEEEQKSPQQTPYNYKPFFGNKLINQSKIDILKQTELAEHCLIFHSGVEHDINFRPDLEVNCGEGSDITCTQTSAINNSIHSAGMEYSEKNSVSRRGGRTLRGTKHHEASNITPTNNSTIPYTTAQSTLPLTDLEKFWEGSELLKALEPGSKHTLSSVITSELDQLEQKRAQLNTKHISRPSHDPNMLLQQVNTALDKLSWSQKPVFHGV